LVCWACFGLQGLFWFAGPVLVCRACFGLQGLFWFGSYSDLRTPSAICDPRDTGETKPATLHASKKTETRYA
jgi:hypothetical protein